MTDWPQPPLYGILPAVKLIEMVTVLPHPQGTTDFRVSPDSGRVAWLVDAGDGKKRVVLDGQPEGKAYDEIRLFGQKRWAAGPLGCNGFSADSRGFAYRARSGLRDWFVVLNGVEGPAYDEAACAPIISSDGARILYPTAKAGKRPWAIDGPDGPRLFQTEGGRHPLVPADLRRVAYWSDPARGAKSEFVVDGRPMPNPPVGWTWSPDGNHWAAGSMRRLPPVGGKPSKSHVLDVLLDGRLVETIASSADGLKFTFGPDSQAFGFAAVESDRKGNKTVVHGNRKYGPYSDVLSRSDARTAPGTLHLSPDGSRCFYVATSGGESKGKWRAYVNGEPAGGTYTSVGEPSFSPDSRHLAFVGDVQHRGTLFLDGKESPEDGGIGEVTFSPDSSQLLYLSKGGWTLVTQSAPPTILKASGHSAKFAPNSKHVLFSESNGTWNVNGVSIKNAVGTDVVFNGDGSLRAIASFAADGTPIRKELKLPLSRIDVQVVRLN